MVRDSIYPVLSCVHWVEYYRLRWGGDVCEVQACLSELRFLRMCLCWFSRCDEDEMRSMVDAIGSRWENLERVLASSKEKSEPEESFQLYKWKRHKVKLYKEFQARTSGKEETEARECTMDYEDYVEEKQDWDVPWGKVKKAIKNWELWSMQIGGTIEECKVHITGHTANLLHCTFKYTCTPSVYQMLKFLDAILQHLKFITIEKPKFLDAILQHLKALLRCVDTEVVPLKKHIEIFEEKFKLLQGWVKLIPSDGVLELGDFRIGIYDDINTDINKLAWLTFFFWAKPGDEELQAELNLLLSEMSRKIIKPSMFDVASWYFGVLKVIRPEKALLLGQVVLGFIDFLFDYLEVPFHYDNQIFRDGLILVYTFLANPPKEYGEDEELSLILDQLGDLLHRGSSLIPQVDDTKKDSSEKQVYLRDFLTMIERLKGKIRTLHNFIPDSSSSNFPRTNVLGFIDFLLQNLKEKLSRDKMFIPFAKHLIIEIDQELVSLRPDLNDIYEQQKEQKELQDTWLQLINLAYLTEHAVNSCSVTLYPIWYNMIRLADILAEIKVVKGKLGTVKHSYSCFAAIPPKAVGSNVEIPRQAWYSEANEVIIGCEEEVDTIVDQLTRGPKSLEIVSIVGMGGSGKSTLARKVYDARQVRSHFHIFAFCIVSQVYSTRKLLLEILKDIKPSVNNLNSKNINSKTDDDLAHLLHQQLSGKRYLVVMDDIWKIEAWEKVKSSFPNDKEGSRVIFTTREREVAMKTQSKFCPHSKRLLSDKQSWELLQTMAFPQAGCPTNLSDIGQEVARNCGGLPLAVTVIGRLLVRKERSLTLWNEIAEKTSSFASEEGCMKVLELSYKNLPEHLKSCFLYLGVFDEDERISVKKLMLLWIAEGFVQISHTESVEIVAKEYLTELVDRSLVNVARRSSDNGIKACQVHDVIHDFCQRKAQADNFFQLIHGVTTYNSSHSNRYRLSIHMGWESFHDAELRDPGIKSLLYNNEYCYGRGSMFSKFQFLEVLDLEKVILKGEQGEINRVLESITSLVHLRYLALLLADSIDIDILSRITCMKNLESFILCHNYYLLLLGETFWRMESLRHLDVGPCGLIPCPPNFEPCPLLYNLECFSTLSLKGKTAMAILQRLPNLSKLSCKFHPYSDNDPILALNILSKLESLKLELGVDVNAILPATLKKLSLDGFSLPSKLGELPRLEVLKIKGDCVKKWDVEDGQFPMLKFLKLKNSRMREWNVSDGSFPRLEQLVFTYCDYLHEIPASFQESTTLNKIQVLKCSSRLANSACEIRDEQNDLGNEIELIISDPWAFSEEESE